MGQATQAKSKRRQKGVVQSLDLKNKTYIGVCLLGHGLPCMYMWAYHMISYVCVYSHAYVHLHVCMHLDCFTRSACISCTLLNQKCDLFFNTPQPEMCFFYQLRYAYNKWGTPMGPAGKAWLQKWNEKQQAQGSWGKGAQALQGRIPLLTFSAKSHMC